MSKITQLCVEQDKAAELWAMLGHEEYPLLHMLSTTYCVQAANLMHQEMFAMCRRFCQYCLREFRWMLVIGRFPNTLILEIRRQVQLCCTLC